MASQVGYQNSKACLPPAGLGTLGKSPVSPWTQAPCLQVERTLSKDDDSGLFSVLTLYESANYPKSERNLTGPRQNQAVPVANTPRIAEMILESLRR